jgi:hypothetical protein
VWNPFNTGGQASRTDESWHDSSRARKCHRSRRHSSLLCGNEPGKKSPTAGFCMKGYVTFKPRLQTLVTSCLLAGAHIKTKFKGRKSPRNYTGLLRTYCRNFYAQILGLIFLLPVFLLLFRREECLPWQE